MDSEPLSNQAAEKLAKAILADGSYVISGHARREMQKDALLDPDVLNVIKAGFCEFSEYENDEWRYRFTTRRITVIVAFDSETQVADVAAWRNQ